LDHGSSTFRIPLRLTPRPDLSVVNWFCRAGFPKPASFLDYGGSAPLLRRKPGRSNSHRTGTSDNPRCLFFLARALCALCALCVSVAIPHFASAQQRQLNIAAASDLKFALTDLAAAYEKQSGVHLSLTFGSSGNFFAQIQNGAPFDLFFSADSDYPRKLNEAGLVLPNSADSYAVGKLVLWSPANSKLNPEKSGWQSLLDPSVQKIAIANPDHAPYGRAALEALKKSGFYEKIKSRLVFGENISQAAQFVQSGNAEIGILAASIASSPSFAAGRSWKIPQDQYAPLLQSFVVLKTSANKSAALAFVAFVKSPAAQAVLEKYGFAKPESLGHPIPR